MVFFARSHRCLSMDRLLHFADSVYLVRVALLDKADSDITSLMNL